jgi:hypothetical protein
VTLRLLRRSIDVYVNVRHSVYRRFATQIAAKNLKCSERINAPREFLSRTDRYRYDVIAISQANDNA